MQCSEMDNVIDLLPYQLRVHIDVGVTLLRCHSAKVLTTTIGYSIVAIVTDLWHHLTYSLRCMPYIVCHASLEL